MPVAWDQFESVDEPTTDVNWQDFEPVTEEAPAPPIFPSNATIKAPPPPMLPATGERSTTYGGPPKSAGDIGQTMRDIGEATGESFSHPGIPFSKLVPEDKPDDSAAVAVGKHAAKIALGIPEFLSSAAGIGTMAVSPLAPAAVSGAFTADMLYNLGKQIKETIPNWDKLSTAQQAGAITDMGGTAIMAMLTGAHATTGALNRMVPARRVADLLNKSEFTPAAKARFGLVQPPSAPQSLPPPDQRDLSPQQQFDASTGRNLPISTGAPAPRVVPPVIERSADPAAQAEMMNRAALGGQGFTPPRPPRPVVPGEPAENRAVPTPEQELLIEHQQQIKTVRDAQAMTKGQVQALFPDMNRQQAAQLRDEVWGKPVTAPPSAEGAARAVINQGVEGGTVLPPGTELSEADLQAARDAIAELTAMRRVPGNVKPPKAAPVKPVRPSVATPCALPRRRGGRTSRRT